MARPEASRYVRLSVTVCLFSQHISAFSAGLRSERAIGALFDTLSAPSSTDARILESVEHEHLVETSNGFSVFGGTTQEQKLGDKEWSDQDFVSRSVGEGNAGPDEVVLDNGHEIFETVQPVLTLDECDNLIAEAREVIAAGLDEKGKFEEDEEGRPTNSQLGEARLSQMRKAKEWLRCSLKERFFPILESTFGIPAEELTLHDALIIGYGYFGGPVRSQPVHRDSSLLSLNVALSPQSDFDVNGGGTFFEGLPAHESVIKTEQGHVLCHAGGSPHAGRTIASGQRWILVLFCIAKNEPQLARRCHAKGMRERARGDLEQAEATFRAGLTVAPGDHLLLSSLAGVLMAKGKQAEAEDCLSAAALSYEHCQKANLGLGRMMLANGRPRAALRRFDMAVEWMDDRDRMPGAWMPLKALGWDARFYGAQAAIICALEAKKRDLEFDPSHLRTAMERMNIALEAAPADRRLLGMICKARELLLKDSDFVRIT